MTCTILRGRDGAPVLQIADCGTIHDEWLQPEEERKLAERLRTEISGVTPEEAVEKVTAEMAAFENNEAWIAGGEGEAKE